jgi:hypothetical protein
MIEDGFIRSDLFGRPPRNDRSWPQSTPSGGGRFLAFPSVHEADVERQERAICAIHLARLMQLFDEFAHGWAGFG